MPEFEVRRHTPERPWTYRDLDQRQIEIAQKVSDGGEGKFLLSEVAPVITVGRRTPQSDFQKSSAEIYPVNRGGLATYHGPGQWILFPVDSLEKLTGDGRGVRKIIERLLDVAKCVAEARGLQVEIKEGAHLGAWTSRGKFAAVGIHVQNGVVQHGLSINGYETPESFQNLKPCGLELPVDYLLQKPDDFEQLRSLIQAISVDSFS